MRESLSEAGDYAVRYSGCGADCGWKVFIESGKNTEATYVGEKIINENSYRAIFCIYAALYITVYFNIRL